ncbi:MAG: ATP-binding protein [bacterium]
MEDRLSFSEKLRTSLSAKITAAILLAATLGALVHGVLGYLVTQERRMAILGTYGSVLAKYLSSYVELQMEAHKGDDLSLLVKGIESWREVREVHLLDSEGNIRTSENPDEIGKRVNLNASGSNFWRPDEKAPDAASISLSNGILTIRRELANKPVCMECHDSGKSLNGYVEVSIAPENVAMLIRSQWPTQGLTGLAILTVLCVVSIWLVRGLILSRISHIRSVVKEVEAGNLAVRTADRSPDEIGEFSRQFDLMIAELEESRRKLEEAHNLELLHFDRLASIGEFSSGLAHELRNPLAGISAVLQRMLKSQDLSQSHRELVTQVHHQLTRLDETTRRLLAFARPETPSLQYLDANEPIRQAMPVLEALAKANASEVQPPIINLELAQDVLPIMGDQKLLQQVLINLVLNGLQAQQDRTRFEQPGVLISTRLEDTSGADLSGQTRDAASNPTCADALDLSGYPDGVVCIEVRDYGPGLAPEVQERMFKPFFTTKKGGTGLGLAVCQRIIKEHGGWLFGTNAQGGGAVFVVCLPVKRDDASPGVYELNPDDGFRDDTHG